VTNFDTQIRVLENELVTLENKLANCEREIEEKRMALDAAIQRKKDYEFSKNEFLKAIEILKGERKVARRITKS
jgi:hypothetical protein